MRVLLNDTVIEEPLNWENLRLRKNRDERWGGIVENAGGEVEEDGLLFRDPLAVAMIRTAWEQQQHAAELYLSVEDGSSVWRSALDWETMQIRDEGVSIGLVDRAARRVMAAAQTQAEWEATDTYTLRGVALGGDITASVPADRALVSGRRISHPVPVKGSSREGLGLYLDADGSLPFWRNDTEYDLTVRLEMALSVLVSIRASNYYEVYVRIYDQSDAVMDSQLVGSYVGGESLWAFAGDLFVRKGYGLGVWVECQEEVYSFTYSTEGGVSVSEVPDQETGVRCLRLDRLLARWAEANGFSVRGGELLSGLYVTSGALLRGAERPMKVNMDLLLADLRRLRNLRIGHSELTVTVYEKTGGVRYIQNIEKLALEPLGLMYSSVVYGFQNWQSKTVQGNMEPNGRFTYASRFDTLGELDLSLAYLVGGRYLMERLRRMRYSPLGEDEDADYDDRLFLLPSMDLVLLQQQAHSHDLYYNHPLSLASADGAAPAGTLLSEAPTYGPYTAVLEMKMPLGDFQAIGDAVYFDYNGGGYRVEVDEAVHSVEDGATVISGKILL